MTDFGWLSNRRVANEFSTPFLVRATPRIRAMRVLLFLKVLADA